MPLLTAGRSSRRAILLNMCNPPPIAEYKDSQSLFLGALRRPGQASRQGGHADTKSPLFEALGSSGFWHFNAARTTCHEGAVIWQPHPRQLSDGERRFPNTGQEDHSASSTLRCTRRKPRQCLSDPLSSDQNYLLERKAGSFQS